MSASDGRSRRPRGSPWRRGPPSPSRGKAGRRLRCEACAVPLRTAGRGLRTDRRDVQAGASRRLRSPASAGDAGLHHHQTAFRHVWPSLVRVPTISCPHQRWPAWTTFRPSIDLDTPEVVTEFRIEGADPMRHRSPLFAAALIAAFAAGCSPLGPANLRGVDWATVAGPDLNCQDDTV